MERDLNGQDPAALGDLVARAAAGEGEAWSELVDRYARRVYALAQSRLRDHDLAEEVSQAVFMSIFQHVSSGRYTEQGQFEPWLFRITMNRIRDQVRRSVRQTSHLRRHEEAAEPGAHSINEPESEDLNRLREAVCSLGDADREVLSLRHQAGLEFKAIAELLGEPVGTLLARHHRALHKLRALLSAPGVTGVRHE